MPRGVHATRVLPRLKSRPAKPQINKFRKQEGAVPLYNAKRRILTSKPVWDKAVLARLRENPFDETWRQYVSQDVTQFVDDMEAQGTKLLPEEKLALVANPAQYFSRPHNVPVNLREQVYFPRFTVTMRRNPYLGPYYAQFNVPLDMSKLDLKSYLKELYNVDVVHIRSFIRNGGIVRKKASSPYTRGPMVRLPSQKRMTVQLVEPFNWPVKPNDVDKSLFSTKDYYDTLRAQEEEGKKGPNDYFGTHLDKKHRKSIAEQAQALLEGKATWAPTWQQIPEVRRTMTGQSVKLTAEEERMRRLASAAPPGAKNRVEAARESTGLDI